MTVADLIDYLGEFAGDTLVFLTEIQAADALEAVEHPEYITLEVLDFIPEEG